MKLPHLPYARSRQQRQTVQFGGLNYTEGADGGDLRDCKGLTTTHYPALTQRAGRSMEGTYSAPVDLFAWGKLCVVDGGVLYYDGKPVGTLNSNGRKQWAVVNTKLCIFPDKKYLDLESLEFGNLDESVSSAEGTTVTFAANSITLQPDQIVARLSSYHLEFWNLNDNHHEELHPYIKVYEKADWDDEAKRWILTGEPEVGINSAVGRKVMLRKSDIEGSYVLNTRAHYKDFVTGVEHNDPDYGENDDKGLYAVITGITTDDSGSGYRLIFNQHEVGFEVHNASVTNDGFDKRFLPGDRVDVTGATNAANNVVKAKVKSVNGRTLTFDKSIFSAATDSKVVTIRRPVPDLDFICESNNRLWGCEGHTIWASALGDPRNFHINEGPSTDSYSVAVGTDGSFTGCIDYSEGVLFWKEDCLHKVLGTLPTNYEVYTYNIAGVQAGSEKSLQIIDEVLYYKGLNGIYAYTGGQPQLISYCFGTKKYDDASGGSDGLYYYVSMRDEAGNYGLYVFDRVHQLWMKEDDSRVPAFTDLGGTIYALIGGSVYRLGDAGADETVEWMAEFAPITEQAHGRKAYSKLYLRLELSQGAWVKVEVKSDGGPWRKVWTTSNSRASTVTVPILPARCDAFSVRLTGSGRCVLRSMARDFTLGSEV